jgi:amidohydrolase
MTKKTMNLKETIQNLADEIFPEILEIRRYIHQHPELSFHEHKTAEYICEVLGKENIPYRKGIAGTGILADIEGRGSGPIVGLRADMDALPIQEENTVAYRSVNDGKMHACGHDVHTACLIGAARILNQLRDRFPGKVKLIFQPAEEKAPGGARLMLKENLFGEEKPDLMIAQHVYPVMFRGSVGFKAGQYMASSDEIYITVSGKGGHAAMPHQITDSVLIASHILVALQQIVSRHAEASTPTVLSVGKVVANGAVNIIPPEVRMEGTFRTMDENWRKEAHGRMINMAQSIADSMGASCEFEIVEGYPVLYNDPGITAKSIEFARAYLGIDHVEELDIRMTAEDFAFFAQESPSVMYRLGVGKPDQVRPLELHTPQFNIDEEAIKTGTGNLAWLALSHLNDA